MHRHGPRRHWRQTVELLGVQLYLNGDPLDPPVVDTVRGSLQPIRRSSAGMPGVAGGVQQETPTHRLFIAVSSEAMTASAYRVNGVNYYATRAPANTGGQGNHLEIELSQTRPL